MEKYIPKNEDDFGGLETLGYCLKKRGKSFEELGDYDFGLYLGIEDGYFVVGGYKVLEPRPSKLFYYETLAELKQSWVLD